jgi:hypothetical protein
MGTAKPLQFHLLTLLCIVPIASTSLYLNLLPRDEVMHDGCFLWSVIRGHAKAYGFPCTCWNERYGVLADGLLANLIFAACVLVAAAYVCEKITNWLHPEPVAGESAK